MKTSTSSQNDSERAIRLLWSGYGDGVFFDVRPHPSSITFEKDLESAVQLAKESSFIGLLPRRREGSKTQDVVLKGNVVWVDIDSPNALGLIEATLRPLGLAPTIVMSSGHGYWFYWKLVDLSSLLIIEKINRGLSALLGGDACHDRTRICRVPGSFNTKYGEKRPVEIVQINEGALYYPRSFRAVLPPKKKASAEVVDLNGITPQPDDRVTWIERIDPDWTGREDLASYVMGEVPAGVDRSQVEFRIAVLLARSGWTRGEIRGFFDAHQLPRHLQNMKRGRTDSFDQMITKIVYLYSLTWKKKEKDSPHAPPVYMGSSNTRMGTRDARARRSETELCRDRFALAQMANGQGRSQFIEEGAQALGLTCGAIEHDLKCLFKSGVLKKRIDPTDLKKRRIQIFQDEDLVAHIIKQGPRGFTRRDYLLPNCMPQKRLKEDERGNHGS